MKIEDVSTLTHSLLSVNAHLQVLKDMHKVVGHDLRECEIGFMAAALLVMETRAEQDPKGFQLMTAEAKMVSGLVRDDNYGESSDCD